MRITLIVMSIFITTTNLCAQDSLSVYEKILGLPDKLFGAIHRKSENFRLNMIKSTRKCIYKLEQQEIKMKRKLAKTDSAKANKIFGDIAGRYNALNKHIQEGKDQVQQVYSSRLDSMTTALKFFQSANLFNESERAQSNMKELAENYQIIQKSLNTSDFVEKYVKERQAYLGSKLQNLPVSKEYYQLQKAVYYYKAQIEEYKNIFNSPEKLERLVLQLATKVPIFKNFFAKYSQLGGLFSLPGGEDLTQSAINSMQTRQMIMQQLERQIGANPSAIVSNNIGSAQTVLRGMRDKLNNLQANGDPSMPNFRPNGEKTKSFLKRLEYGFNIQSAKSTYFFVTTTDIGISAGYKLNPKSIIGIGGSYKIGWGKDWRHIQLSHQGLSLRTFWDLRFKSNFWLSAGWEQNYQTQSSSLQNTNPWQQSALAGLSKKYKIKKHNGEFKIMYDFFWSKQRPSGQPIVFRTGYKF